LVGEQVKRTPNLSEIVVRKMKPQDLDSAMDILRAWNMAPWTASADNPNPERSGLVIENSFVALDGKRVVGVASYLERSPEEAETASLAVDPDYRGKGIGYMLQRARLDEMAGKGYTSVRTETDRPETIEWYIRKFGYRRVGTNKKKHDFSLPEVDTWTVLELDLVRYAKK
jgi:ribosomal protein S18 acetylase RimI-like enzyme